MKTDVFNEIAMQKLGIGDNWKWFQARVVTGGYIIKGAVPIGVYKRGKKTGRTKWPAESQTVIITKEEFEIAAEEHEKEKIPHFTEVKGILEEKEAKDAE